MIKKKGPFEVVCKNCRFEYEEHRAADNACPIWDGESDVDEGTFRDSKTTFEPREEEERERGGKAMTIQPESFTLDELKDKLKTLSLRMALLQRELTESGREFLLLEAEKLRRERLVLVVTHVGGAARPSCKRLAAPDSLEEFLSRVAELEPRSRERLLGALPLNLQEEVRKRL